jgi:hypothetical protein
LEIPKIAPKSTNQFYKKDLFSEKIVLINGEPTNNCLPCQSEVEPTVVAWQLRSQSHIYHVTRARSATNVTCLHIGR